MTMSHASNLQKTTRRGFQILFFVLATLCLLFVMSYASRLNEYTRVQQESTLWQHKIEYAQNRQAELLAYRDYIQSDDYVAQVAREELNMVQPGDNVVVVVAGDGQEGVVRRADSAVLSPMLGQPPIWQQWFSLFVQQSSSYR